MILTQYPEKDDPRLYTMEREDCRQMEHTQENNIALISHANQSEMEEKKRLLTEENSAYINRISELSVEIERVNSSLASINEDMETNEEKIREYPGRIEGLKSKSEILVAKLNSIKLKVMSSREDEESTRLLRKTLTEEYENLKNERTVLVKRIHKMETALDEISDQRERQLPKLKKYDGMLREARNVFYDAESRMEVSLKLKQGKSACKLPHI